MQRFVPFAVAVCLLACSTAAAQQSVGEERVEVNLVYVETLVTDAKGNTVPGLTKDDFLLSVGGKAEEIDVFDVNCTGGAIEEPTANVADGWRKPVPGPHVPRRIVFAFDYNTMPKAQRSGVVDYARYMLARGKTTNEEVMVVALADGVRIEQRFTKDPAKLDKTLQRMEHDLTLYARDFGGGVSGRTYFDTLSTLMDVLAQYDSPKAVVLFSEWMGASATNDNWFFEVAHHAAAARAAIYPVFTAGLQAGAPAGGPPGLSRLANESGGRTTFRTNDLSLGYARAQRDMACRYGVGFYIEEDTMRPRRVSVRVTRTGLRTRSPEQVKFFTPEQQLDSRLRAAVVDPEHFENPYVRAHVMPVGPSSKSSWDTLVALHFRMLVDEGGNDLDVVATLTRGITPVSKFHEQFHIDPTADGTPQPVTIYGDDKLKPGAYQLNIALSKSGNDVPQTTIAKFSVPEMPDDSVILRGPLLAKVLDSGVLIRTKEPGPEAQKTRSALRELIGDEGSFQPLLIHEVDPDDTLLSAWNACTLEKKEKNLPTGTVERHVVNDDGEVVHTLEPRALELTGKKVRCQTVLDSIAAKDLGPGEYRVEVIVKNDGGKVLAKGLAPLRVKEAE